MLPTSREYAPPVHPELELLHDPGHHADRHVDDQQNAEEPGQPQVVIAPAAVPRRLQQRGQERQADRDRDEEEMIDRHKRELHPRQVDVRHRLSPVSEVPGAATGHDAAAASGYQSDPWTGGSPSCQDGIPAAAAASVRALFSFREHV